MELFKKKIRRNNIMIGIAIIVGAFTYITLLLNMNQIMNFNVLTNTSAADFIRGFNTGLFGAIEVILIISFIKNLLALKDESKLKKMYIACTDERNIAINQAIGTTGFHICSYLLILATIIAGFISTEAFFGLLIATFIVCGTKIVLTIYYTKKF